MNILLQSANNDDDACSFKSKESDGTSLANIASTSSASATVGNDSQSNGVQSWGTSFEKLLEDASGLRTFAEFLKKEFSAENIYFWTACERYRKTVNHATRKKQSMEIFAKHMEDECKEPVNVDSQARTLAEERLKYAEPELFAQVIIFFFAVR